MQNLSADREISNAIEYSEQISAEFCSTLKLNSYVLGTLNDELNTAF